MFVRRYVSPLRGENFLSCFRFAQHRIIEKQSDPDQPSDANLNCGISSVPPYRRKHRCPRRSELFAAGFFREQPFAGKLLLQQRQSKPSQHSQASRRKASDKQRHLYQQPKLLRTAMGVCSQRQLVRGSQAIRMTQPYEVLSRGEALPLAL